MKRLSHEKILKCREQFYNDPLYVSFSDAIDEVETKIGGLTPEEVWVEVIRIGDELAKTRRPEKTIQNIRTELETDYQFFTDDNGGILEQRLPMAGEWTSIVVLTCLMFYLCTPKEVPELNMKIAVKIRKLIWDHPAYVMLRRLQRPAEKSEEDDGNPIPDEDRLHPLISKRESPELEAMRNRIIPVITFFANTLMNGNAVTAAYQVKIEDKSKHLLMWHAILRNEALLRALCVDELEKKNFKASKDGNYKAAAEGKYNLKLILNIIGVMKAEGIIDLSNENLSGLFFTSLRASYFSKDKLREYGTKHSALTQELHDNVIAIIRTFKNPMSTSE